MAQLNIFINVKSIGKRKPALSAIAYTLESTPANLRELISAIAKKEAEAYNGKKKEAMLLPYLTQEQIEQQGIAGKVGFGRIYSDKKADPAKAVEVAIGGFEDGLFRVIIGERECTQLDSALDLKDGDVLTFIRLTFLAGGLW
ncbi:MAG: hypothetical protein FWB75_01170 [Oscillospiraceae bacterium]|nr:hypothetical protein [Oscillospiraceae bacterium]